MKIDIRYYKGWIAWAISRTAGLAPSQWPAYAGDILQPFQLCLNMLASIPMGGKLFILALNLLAWAKANPDPLSPVRAAMEAAREKWH